MDKPRLSIRMMGTPVGVADIELKVGGTYSGYRVIALEEWGALSDHISGTYSVILRADDGTIYTCSNNQDPLSDEMYCIQGEGDTEQVCVVPSDLMRLCYMSNTLVDT